MATNKVLAIDKFPSLGKFMFDWNKSWRESSLFLEWLQKWNEEINSTSAVDKFLEEKIKSEDYKSFLKLSLDSVIARMFQEVILHLGWNPSKPFDIVNEYAATNERHRDLILNSIKNWMNLEFFRGKAVIHDLLKDVADPEKIHCVLLKLFPDPFKDLSIKKGKAPYLMAVETILDKLEGFGKLDLQSYQPLLRLKFSEGLLTTYLENSTLQLFKDKNYLECLLKWWKQITLEYDNVQIVDLSNSFADGMAICAFIDKFGNGSINYQSLTTDTPVDNWRRALRAAEMFFGIPPLFKAEDVADLVNRKSMLIVLYAFKCLTSVDGRLYEQQLLCPVCHERATNLKDLHNHMESHLWPNLSGFWFDEIMLKQHELLEIPMTCNTCNADFCTMSSYGTHQADEHDKMFCWFYHCNHCSDSKEDCLKHVKSHLPLLIGNCDECIQSLLNIVAHHWDP